MSNYGLLQTWDTTLYLDGSTEEVGSLCLLRSLDLRNPSLVAWDFETVEPPELEDVLADATEPLEMRYAGASADSPIIRSGSLFTHVLFVQHGTVVPWQYPYSELEAPFLIGDHEFLMDAERWVASYSAVTEAIVVWIPVALMKLAVDRIPRCT